MEPTTDKKSNGALVGAIIVILILVLGGFYLWQTNSLKDKEDGSEPIPVNTEQQSYLEELNMASVIEADLSALDTENSTADADFTADVNALQ